MVIDIIIHFEMTHLCTSQDTSYHSFKNYITVWLGGLESLEHLTTSI